MSDTTGYFKSDIGPKIDRLKDDAGLTSLTIHRQGPGKAALQTGPKMTSEAYGRLTTAVSETIEFEIKHYYPEFTHTPLTITSTPEGFVIDMPESEDDQ